MEQAFTQTIPESPVQDWQLRPTPKYASHGVVRMVRPADTIRRVTPLMASIGVTRVGDVTHLDRVGIPNFISVRPNRQGDGISYHNGKGYTRLSAKAGAMMEAIEHFTGEQCKLPVSYASFSTMAQRGAVVDPREINVPSLQEYDPELPMEWVEGFDLLAQQPTYVPLNAVACPYDPPAGCPRLFYASTNGLASGNTVEEALCHALCEVIERDAEAVAFTTLTLIPAVSEVLASLGIGPSTSTTNSGGATRGDYPLIDLTTLPARGLRLVAKLKQAGLRVYLRNITPASGIPTFYCSIVESQLDGSHLSHGGCGTHPDVRVALTRALTEAAQSRVGCIQGGREDLPEFIKPPAASDLDNAYAGDRVVPFSSVFSFQHTSVDDDIRFILQRLASTGFSQVVAINVTIPELGIPVVRVVIPRAETWTVFHMHTQRGVFGARIGQILREA